MCRNVALATLMAVPVLCAGGYYYQRLDDLVLAAAAAVVAGVMVLRFPKYLTFIPSSAKSLFYLGIFLTIRKCLPN